jgi:ribosomal-protein-serine acetyltransferase
MPASRPARSTPASPRTSSPPSGPNTPRSTPSTTRKARPDPSGCALAIGEGSHLRLLDERDAPELHALIEANRERLSEWLPWAAAQDPEDTRAFIAGAREQVARNDGFQVAIVRRARITGVIGHVSVDWGNRAAGIGYWLGEEFEGEGTMTAAVRALTGHALVEWQLNRVEIRVATGNRRSRAVPERLGFREEGTLRRAQRIGNRYVDTVVYSMLAEDSSGRS